MDASAAAVGDVVSRVLVGPIREGVRGIPHAVRVGAEGRAARCPVASLLLLCSAWVRVLLLLLRRWLLLLLLLLLPTITVGRAATRSSPSKRQGRVAARLLRHTRATAVGDDVARVLTGAARVGVAGHSSPSAEGVIAPMGRTVSNANSARRRFRSACHLG